MKRDDDDGDDETKGREGEKTGKFDRSFQQIAEIMFSLYSLIEWNRKKNSSRKFPPDF